MCMEYMGFCQRLKTTLSGIASRSFPRLFQYQKLATTTLSATMSGRFRSYVWDPFLIISQIVTLQCVFYSTLGLMIATCVSLGGHAPSLKLMFNTSSIHYIGQANRLVLIAHMINSLLGALALWYIVQRAKQCLDFTCTLHFIHFVICCVYSSHFPAYITWWLVQLACIVLMVVVGEYLCFRSDMKDIPLVGNKADV